MKEETRLNLMIIVFFLGLLTGFWALSLAMIIVYFINRRQNK